MRQGCGIVGTIILLVIFCLVGAGVSVYGSVVLQNAAVSKTWPTASGRILLAQVDTDTDEDGTTYSADVSYEYFINDQRYQDDTVSFGEYGSGNPKHAQEIVDRYPVGQAVTVYYDPEQPKTAVLEPGVTWSSYLMLGIGLLFMFIPGIIMISSLFSRLGLIR